MAAASMTAEMVQMEVAHKTETEGRSWASQRAAFVATNLVWRA